MLSLLLVTVRGQEPPFIPIVMGFSHTANEVEKHLLLVCNDVIKLSKLTTFSTKFLHDVKNAVLKGLCNF